MQMRTYAALSESSPPTSYNFLEGKPRTRCNAEASDEVSSITSRADLLGRRLSPTSLIPMVRNWGPRRGWNGAAMRQDVRNFFLPSPVSKWDHEPGTDAATHVDDVPVKSTGTCCILDHISPAPTWRVCNPSGLQKLLIAHVAKPSSPRQDPSHELHKGFLRTLDSVESIVLSVFSPAAKGSNCHHHIFPPPNLHGFRLTLDPIPDLG